MNFFSLLAFSDGAWLAITMLIQIFLWVVVGGALAFIVIAPIFLCIFLIWLIGSLTINNLLNLIHKIPILGVIVSGLIATGIGVMIIILGIWVWVNYAFIMLRCIGGPKL